MSIATSKNGTRRKRRESAFTLIEVMIVVGIAAMVMAIGVPFVYNMLHRDPLRQAVSDIMEACNHTRARAIFSSAPAELRILPREHLFQVVAGSGGGQDTGGPNVDGTPGATTAVTGSAPNFSAHLADDITIELLDVNFHPYKDADETRVRFFPNGTSDEFTVVIQYRQQQWKKISLDPVTGMPDVEIIR